MPMRRGANSAARSRNRRRRPSNLDETVERMVPRRQLIVDDGDVILSREMAGSVSLSRTAGWRYRLHVHPDAIGGKLRAIYASYQLAAMAGEELAARQRVRLYYEEDAVVTLLKDYRPT